MSRHSESLTKISKFDAAKGPGLGSRGAEGKCW